MKTEEQLLDLLLDGTKAGSVDDTIKVHPNEQQLDENKTTGRRHRTLLKEIIGRIKAWVKAELLDKSNVGHQHTIGEVDNLQTTLNSHNQRITENANALPGKADLVGGIVPAEQLPDLAPTVESTDDIQNEGVTNLWFTEARVVAAKATANLWAYIGLASASATISLKGWLDFLTNKVKLNEEQIALRVKQVKQGAATYSPDANGLLILPEGADSTREGTYTALTLAASVNWNITTAIKEGKRTLTIPNGWPGTAINFSVSNASTGFTGILAIYNNDAVSHAIKLPTGGSYAVASGLTSSVNIPAGGVVELNIAFDGIKIKITSLIFQAV